MWKLCNTFILLNTKSQQLMPLQIPCHYKLQRKEVVLKAGKLYNQTSYLVVTMYFCMASHMLLWKASLVFRCFWNNIIKSYNHTQLKSMLYSIFAKYITSELIKIFWPSWLKLPFKGIESTNRIVVVNIPRKI